MERAYDTPRPLAVSIRVPAGSVRVRTTTASMTTIKTEGERNPDDLRIELVPSDGGDKLIVEHSWKRAWGIFSLGHALSIDIEVPEGAHLSCDSGAADIRADGPLGNLTVRTASGDVIFSELAGDLVVKNGSGDVSGGRAGGGVSVYSASGDVRIDSAGGDVSIRTASGDVELGAADSAVQVTAVSGDVRLRSLVAGKANVRTVSGDIEVGIAEGTGVYMDVGSTSGDVRSDLEPGAGGRGGAHLELEAFSTSGDVRVRRAPRRDRASA
jgi:DUF4097 and DUF4098 domain-containing protein YvlB